jgi:hypothetical protein
MASTMIEAEDLEDFGIATTPLFKRADEPRLAT